MIHSFFRLVEFLHVKMLDEPGLIAVIDQTWWDSGGMDRDVEERKKGYLRSCTKVYEAISSKKSFN